jgi:hypothetical protein
LLYAVAVEDLNLDPRNPCRGRLRLALRLADQLSALANESDSVCGRDECLIFFGVVRDCAHAIQGAAGNKALRVLLHS